MVTQPSGGFQVISTTDKARPADLDEELLRMRSDIDGLLSAPAKTATVTKTAPVVQAAQIQPAQSVQPVGPVGVIGTLTSYAREDHVHAGVQSYRGTVVLGSPSAIFAVTHGLAIPAPFLVTIDIYTSTGVLVETAGATFVFTTNGLTITFGAPLAPDTYSIIVTG